MPPQALGAMLTLLGIAQHGNRIELKLEHGQGEIVWVTPSTFRFRITVPGLSEELPPAKAAGDGPSDAVELEIQETARAVRMRSRFIEVSIGKRGMLLDVRRADGARLIADGMGADPTDRGMRLRRALRPEARYYGLGPREDEIFDARGQSLVPKSRFLYSTLGYGEYWPNAANDWFQFGSAGFTITGGATVDFYFYYGPSLKQVLEEHNRVRGTSALWPASTERAGTWATLRSSLLRIVQGAISGEIAPSFDLGAYANAESELQQRARQLGSLVAEVSPGKLGLSSFREQLASFFEVYAYEANEKGYPPWHPLPFQFPEDPECARRVDEFMLGDEMLVAPIVAPGGAREVYLPQGVWTNLESNEVYPGRKTITVKTASLPVFARNGTIVPLNSKGGMALHYFPKLGAEFFLVEEDAWTQVHAAPAADILRLQIESKKTRDYQWVVHHVDRPASVGFEDRQYREVTGGLADQTWSYDAKARNLQVRVKVAAGEDRIINVAFN